MNSIAGVTCCSYGNLSQNLNLSDNFEAGRLTQLMSLRCITKFDGHISYQTVLDNLNMQLGGNESCHVNRISIGAIQSYVNDSSWYQYS